MAISIDKLGGRTVHLFIPFEYNGKRVDSITFAPFKFDTCCCGRNGTGQA